MVSEDTFFGMLKCYIVAGAQARGFYFSFENIQLHTQCFGLPLCFSDLPNVSITILLFFIYQ